MIDVNDPILFQASCNELANFRRQAGRSLRGRFVQLFLALKFYQDEIPSMYSIGIKLIPHLLGCFGRGTGNKGGGLLI
jgi:hypothetical protein